MIISPFPEGARSCVQRGFDRLGASVGGSATIYENFYQNENCIK